MRSCVVFGIGNLQTIKNRLVNLWRKSVIDLSRQGKKVSRVKGETLPPTYVGDIEWHTGDSLILFIWDAEWIWADLSWGRKTEMESFGACIEMGYVVEEVVKSILTTPIYERCTLTSKAGLCCTGDAYKSLNILRQKKPKKNAPLSQRFMVKTVRGESAGTEWKVLLALVWAGANRFGNKLAYSCAY